jgi:DNA-binding CsgD family transcriptional regulator
MARAAAAGMVMVRGECLPVAGTLPLLPAASALGELAGWDGGRLVEAALATVPEFVRAEVGRLVPQLGPSGAPGPEGRGEGWQRERLFAAVAQLLSAVAVRSETGVGVVVEDVHWADSETLDCLTFLSRAAQSSAVWVVVTCRSDEAPLAPQVAGWLVQARGAAATEEITLGPLSWAEVAGQAAALTGRPVPPVVVDELFARAGGNPFFTEQLVAAALADAAVGIDWRVPAGLPARLAGLLAARAERCGEGGKVVLDALAVAGRPLGEDLLGEIAGLERGAVRRGLRELAGARLLAEDTTGGGHRPRHALLAEAVAGGLLPGERAALHGRTARALAAAGDENLAAEVAGHWQAAGYPGEELPARVAAAGAAERVFGYAEAAAHWQRAIELCQDQPGVAAAAGIDVPRVYVRAIDALYLSGDGERAGVIAEEAYRRFAGHPDPAVAAVVRHRVASHRSFDSPAAGLPLIEEALRLYEQERPSADQVWAWLDYADLLYFTEGQGEDVDRALNRALEVAEAAGATAQIPHVLASLADSEFLYGRIEEGFAVLARGWALARATDDGPALMQLAEKESGALLAMARFADAAHVAVTALEAARQAGLGASLRAAVLAFNACEALLASGLMADAAALIDPLTTGTPDLLHWPAHEARAEIDLLLGDIAAAGWRRQQIDALFDGVRHAEFAAKSAQRAIELALWDGRPGDALTEAQGELPLYQTPDLAVGCGWLLVLGMRACADLAEHARARRDEPAAEDAVVAADGLVLWTERMGGAPFLDHTYVAAIPAERATWEAERTRLAGPSDPQVWGGAAKAWHDLGCPHRAGYAWWRQAQAHLDAGQPPTAAAAALRAAAAAADSHQPLLAEIRKLAERARIPLQTPSPTHRKAAAPAGMPAPYGLTGRELAVLRLVAAGRSNTQIGAELFISRATASVHVTSILRKLGVTSRVQAAALAERAGLLDAPRP